MPQSVGTLNYIITGCLAIEHVFKKSQSTGYITFKTYIKVLTFCVLAYSFNEKENLLLPD